MLTALIMEVRVPLKLYFAGRVVSILAVLIALGQEAYGRLGQSISPFSVFVIAYKLGEEDGKYCHLFSADVSAEFLDKFARPNETPVDCSMEIQYTRVSMEPENTFSKRLSVAIWEGRLKKEEILGYVWRRDQAIDSQESSWASPNGGLAGKEEDS
ncbi:hypothetical protein MCOR31_004341 [Pyricularia oryzae]|uniref:Uncharacterized protein n=1 Tax=Pyricularia grisea TaxID=148305 RepID=A0ABQ8NNP9_PYRGI|nr:hypothetical protein MCOR26_002216 [Pyricularia oryzae]KAI6299673.1 hypothetical protein MCOR33_004481 [Pyricularia grisea]KAI6331443.1 hypothetical protein MCOR30_004802 [Pyricularia oryzae]KAI6371070.1 hypothetical protein MCOR31_004341 [Pyricularia oryzae]KAI6373325.1 hypothetical protein MCOR32_005776 [Pyricularia oryzae]